MVQTDAIKKVQNYVDIVTAAGIPIEKAFLFGSYARNEQKKDSDIDVLLVSETFDNDDDKYTGIVWTLTRKIDTKIEPFTMGLKNFYMDDVSPLLYTIKNEGIQIK